MHSVLPSVRGARPSPIRTNLAQLSLRGTTSDFETMVSPKGNRVAFNALADNSGGGSVTRRESDGTVTRTNMFGKSIRRKQSIAFGEKPSGLNAGNLSPMSPVASSEAKFKKLNKTPGGRIDMPEMLLPTLESGSVVRFKNKK